MRPVVGIDLMGGDIPPQDIFLGITDRLSKLKNHCELRFFVTKELYKILSLIPISCSCTISWEICDDFIDSHEDPLIAVRKKRSSTLTRMLDEAFAGTLQGCISMGNTGAIVADVNLFGSKIPGIRRPALLAEIPTKSANVALLDVGANVRATPELLIEFSQLGIAYLMSRGRKKIKLGLVNIGEEQIKGDRDTRSVYQQLSSLYAKQEKVQFVGNMETHRIFLDPIDLLVTDGFTGNTILKTAEGLSMFLLEELLHIAEDVTIQEKISTDLRRFFGHDSHPGALLLGADTLIMKCHGRSDGKQIFYSIVRTLELIEENFLSSFKNHLNTIMHSCS